MKKIAFAIVALSLGISLIGCGNDNAPTNSDVSTNLFDEINEKVKKKKKSLGSLASSASISRADTPNQGDTIYYPAYCFELMEVPSFVNKQQQMLYIMQK